MNSIDRLRSAAIAAAEGLSDADDATVDDDLALVRLVAIGDVLRAFRGVAPYPIPAALREWLKTASSALIAGAMHLHATSIAGSVSCVHRADEALPFSLLMRDQAESIVAALCWRSIVVPSDDAIVAAVKRLYGAADAFDRAIIEDGVIVREVASMLGDRASLPL